MRTSYSVASSYIQQLKLNKETPKVLGNLNPTKLPGPDCLHQSLTQLLVDIFSKGITIFQATVNRRIKGEWNLAKCGVRSYFPAKITVSA